MCDFGAMAWPIKFITPSYWLQLNERGETAPLVLRQLHPKERTYFQGEWSITGNRVAPFISVGETNSLKDVFLLLHEIGHYETNSEVAKTDARELDQKTQIELLSERERRAWAYALKQARAIKKSRGVNLFEGFSDVHELREFIYNKLLGYRYGKEIELSGIPTNFLKKIVIDILKIDPKSKNLEWLGKLFDKKKLAKK